LVLKKKSSNRNFCLFRFSPLPLSSSSSFSSFALKVFFQRLPERFSGTNPITKNFKAAFKNYIIITGIFRNYNSNLNVLFHHYKILCIFCFVLLSLFNTRKSVTMAAGSGTELPIVRTVSRNLPYQ